MWYKNEAEFEADERRRIREENERQRRSFEGSEAAWYRAAYGDRYPAEMLEVLASIAMEEKVRQ